jgi:tripartite-type tricarboxylate transporter receptor subunit TctC
VPPDGGTGRGPDTEAGLNGGPAFSKTKLMPEVPMVADKVNKAASEALKSPEVQQKMATQYMEPVGGTPASFGVQIRSDEKRLGDIVKRAGIRAE